MTRFTVSLLIFLGAFVVAMAGQAQAGPYPAGDAEKGAKVFKKCVSCHMIGDKAKNRVGPHLNNIISRNIGAIDGFKYS
ncbi:MAG: c-type cytochrome, partial [Pseudomonadota bacterium]|nr:c-type cytochrome [Pseudomonadota bacterium]